MSSRCRTKAACEIGKAFRELIGHDDIAMTAVQVAALIEDRAKVEIEATAVVPDESRPPRTAAQ
jgi:enamine deaminase RidA (YjgF/YER057c/UK114 family)